MSLSPAFISPNAHAGFLIVILGADYGGGQAIGCKVCVGQQLCKVYPCHFPPVKCNRHKARDTFGTRCPPMPLSLQALFKEHLTLISSFFFLIEKSTKFQKRNGEMQTDEGNLQLPLPKDSHHQDRGNGCSS